MFLATQMIPAQVTLIPFYLLMSQLGWVDSHLALIVPGMLANPFAVFLMRQFVLSLPKGDAEKLKANVVSQQPLMAPVTKGQTVGTLQLSLNDKPVVSA